MRDFAKISCSIWRSRKFTGLPNDEARYLYLYLHTCPHVNSLGCYVLPEGYAMADLKWTDPQAFRKGIETLCQAGLIGFQEDESVVRIVDFLKHSPFTNPNHAAGAIALLDAIPDGAEKDCLINDLAACKHVQAGKLPGVSGKPLESLSEPSRNTETETERERETETKRESADALLGDYPSGTPRDGGPSRDDIREAIEVFNVAASRQSWPVAQKLTEARRSSLRARIMDAGGLEGWSIAIAKAEASDFICGRTEKSWTGFGLDWLISPKNFTKLMEGNYDNRTAAPGIRPSGSAHPVRSGQPGGIVGAAMRSRSA